MDADPKFDALVGRDLGVALDHRPLDFNGKVHSVDHAAKLDDRAVAGALDDAAVMHCDGRVDQVAAKGPKASKDSIFIRTRKPRIADDVGHQDRRELSSLGHGASAEVRSPVAGGTGMAARPCCTGRDVEAGVQSRVSTGRSIHAAPSITPSPREGIEDGPRLRVRTRSNRAGRGRPEDPRRRHQRRLTPERPRAPSGGL
jgi:hypothetical protein